MKLYQNTYWYIYSMVFVSQNLTRWVYLIETGAESSSGIWVSTVSLNNPHYLLTQLSSLFCSPQNCFFFSVHHSKMKMNLKTKQQIETDSL